MRFTVEQRFRHDPAAVARALADPQVLGALPDLPKLSRPEVLSREVDGAHVSLALRYRFEGELSSAARAVLDPGRLSWVERSRHDLSARTGTFTMEPDHYADRFTCRGTYRIEAAGGGSRRVVEGELKVRAALVGGAVERAIVSGLREHLDEQAPAVDALLDGGG